VNHDGRIHDRNDGVYGLLALLVIVVLILLAAALLKYLFAERKGDRQ
jgi:hypothetical protein